MYSENKLSTKKSIYKFILKNYVKFQNRYSPEIIARLQQKIGDGVHYTNIFNRRWEFFFENTNKNDVVIDIACGTGTILKNISKNIKYGIGLELNPSNYEMCLRDISSFGNLKFIREDIFEADYSKLNAEFGFTTAVLSHILEHLEYPGKFLEKINVDRLLICVPSEENPWADFVKSLGLEYKTDSTHFREYTRSLLDEHLNGAGYKKSFVGFNQQGEIICIANKSK